MRVTSFLAFVTAALIGCETDRPRDPGTPQDAGAADAAPDAGSNDGGITDSGVPAGEELVACPVGSTLVHRSLSPLAQVPSVAELELTGLPNGAEVLSAGTGQSYSARFDLCRDANGQHSLRGVLWTMDDFGAPYYFLHDATISAAVQEFIEYRGGFISLLRLPPSAFIANGVTEALNGNLQPLELRFVNDSGLLVLGHDDFIAGTLGMVGPSSITYTNIYVIAGGLIEGDVFASRPCPFGENMLMKTWRMGTADFAVEACTFLGGGHTAGYRINRLSVTDSSSELSGSEQEAFIFVGEAAVEAVMNYRWNHHNACDSFHLALPHADYAATTAPLAGCGLPVPNAPMRDINDDPSGPVEYRIRYHGGAWTDGTIPGCTHYMFCP